MADPGFAEVSEGDWEAAAERALRGEPLASLLTTLLDGIETSPLYTPHRHGTEGDPAGLPGEAPYLRGASAASGGAGWEVRQTHDVRLAGTPDAVAVDTTSGVDAVTVARGWHAKGDAAALEAGIGDAAEAGVTVHLQAGTSPEHAQALLDVLSRRGVTAEQAQSWLGIDPVAASASGWAARTANSSGGAPADEREADAAEGRNVTSATPGAGRRDTDERDAGMSAADELRASLRAGSLSAAEIAERWPNVVPLEADGSVFADAGATDTTELAAMLAGGVAWLRALCDAPEGPALPPSAAARLIGFTMSAGPDPLVVTAKCRALRQCWARVLEASGADAVGDDGPDHADRSGRNRHADSSDTGGRSGQGASDAASPALPMRLHAVASTAMLSRRDPWVNMLRATAATFGAANGGADAITVRPFDSIGDNSASHGSASSELGWRVAANTQLILRDESRVGSVIDPAGGSWYLEDLTQSMAAAAWTGFQQTEAAGGICAVLADGQIEAAIAAERARRHEQLESGHSVLVGVTQFAPPAEAPSAASAESAPTPDADSAASGGGLGIHRWAAPFEDGAVQR